MLANRSFVKSKPRRRPILSVDIHLIVYDISLQRIVYFRT